MYHYIFGLTMLKSLSPYFRKHILTTLHSHELLFVQTFFISIFVLLFFLYKFYLDRENVMIKNIYALKWTQLCCIFFIAILTVLSSILLYEMDKKFNTPLINAIFMRVGSTIALLFVSIIIFNERYTISQIIGFIFVLFGIYLIGSKKGD